MKRKNLGFKVWIGFLSLAVILILFISALVCRQYWKETMNEYNEIAHSYTRTAARYIDGDRVLSYLETNTEDDYYQKIEDFLNATQEETELKYYYVFVPNEEDLVYIWDADHSEGSCPIGYHEEYMKDGKEVAGQTFRQNPVERIIITKDDTYGYIASAFSPIFDSAGVPVALVGVDLSMDGIQDSILKFILMIVVSVIIVIICSMCLFYLYISKKVVAPIKQLNRAAGEIVTNLESDKQFILDIHTGDEIEELGQTFVKMDEDMRSYILELGRVTAEKERIEAELDVATKIQVGMLPRNFPKSSKFELFAMMTPAKEVGGDFYDFFIIDEDHLCIDIGDVSGKGVPAALFMVISKTIIKNYVLSHLPLDQVLTKANEQLCEGNDAQLFTTAWIGILEFSTGRLLFADAGHDNPLIRKTDGSFEYVKPKKKQMMLAGMEGIQYALQETFINPGEMLFLYTDGIPEANNCDAQFYGQSRLEEILSRTKGTMPKETLEQIKADVDLFAGQAPQFDDMTMLAVYKHA